MRSENRSRWVNLLLPTLRQMTTCLTSWLRRPVVQNAARLLVGLFMTLMTTSQSNRTWSGKTSQLTPVTRLILRGLREYDQMEGVSAGIDASWWTDGVSEMAEHFKKVRCDVDRPLHRPGIEWHVPDACLTREHDLEFSFCFDSGSHLTTIFRPL